MTKDHSIQSIHLLTNPLFLSSVDFTQHYSTITPAGLVLSADAPKLSIHQRFMAFSELDRVAIGKVKNQLEREQGAWISLSETMDMFESGNE